MGICGSLCRNCHSGLTIAALALLFVGYDTTANLC
jgi:hypothetical protein